MSTMDTFGGLLIKWTSDRVRARRMLCLFICFFICDVTVLAVSQSILDSSTCHSIPENDVRAYSKIL